MPFKQIVKRFLAYCSIKKVFQLLQDALSALDWEVGNDWPF